MVGGAWAGVRACTPAAAVPAAAACCYRPLLLPMSVGLPRSVLFLARRSAGILLQDCTCRARFLRMLTSSPRRSSGCRKENQVYTAEEKAALAMFNFEENKRKEAKILEEMRRLVGGRWLLLIAVDTSWRVAAGLAGVNVNAGSS